MTPNFAHLGKQVQQRRLELGMSQVDLWQAGGPSNSTITNIENGTAKTVSAATRKKLDRGLRWAPGSADRVIEGGLPLELSDYLADDPDELSTGISDPSSDESVAVTVSLTPRKVVEIQIGLSGIRELVGLYGDELITPDDFISGVSHIEDLTTRILRSATEQTIEKFGRLRYVEAIRDGSGNDDDMLEDDALSERMAAILSMAEAEADWIKANQAQKHASKMVRETGQKVVDWIRSFADKVGDDPSRNPLGLDKRYFLSDELAWKAVRQMERGDDGRPFIPSGPYPDEEPKVWDDGDRWIAESMASMPTMVDAFLDQGYDSSMYLSDVSDSESSENQVNENDSQS